MESKDKRLSQDAKSGLTREELYEEISASVWPSADTQDEQALLETGTAGQRAFYAVTLFTRLVANGGIPSAIPSYNFLLKDVRTGYVLLGLTDRSAALDKILDLFTAVIPEAQFLAVNPRDAAAMQEMVENIWYTDALSLHEEWEAVLSDERAMYPAFDNCINTHPELFFKDN